MRILVVGAGSIGGYFGGRLWEAGRDVTFLVRSRRAGELARTGLAIRSPVGDVNLPAPPTVAAERLSEPFDLVLLSCKAYDLSGAINAFAPGVGPETDGRGQAPPLRSELRGGVSDVGRVRAPPFRFALVVFGASGPAGGDRPRPYTGGHCVGYSPPEVQRPAPGWAGCSTPPMSAVT